MGEFNWNGETYTEGSGGGDFIDQDAFNRLVYTDAVCFITAVREGISNFDPKKPQEQWLIDFVSPDETEYTKGFTKGNAERDARIVRLRNTLAAAPDEPIDVSFIKVGRRFDIAAPKYQ